MNYIDIITILVFACSVVLGYKKGFLRTITGLFALVLSLYLSTVLYPYVSELVMNTPVYDTVYENTESLVTITDKEDSAPNVKTGKLNLPTEFTKDIEKEIDEATDTVAENVAKTVASASVKIICILFLFILIRLLLFIITKLAGVIRRLPVIGWGDALLGGLFGIVRGFLILYILFALVTFVASVAPESVFVRDVKHAEFARVIYNNNVLLDFLR